MTHPDNSGPTFADVKTYARNRLRLAFGTDRIPYLEAQMATAAQQIQQLGTKVEGVGNVAADILADFRTFRDAMIADRENPTAAGQAAIDRANANLDAAVAKLTDLDVAVGDADGSDTPAPPVEEPTDPATPTEPTEPTNPHTPSGPTDPA